MTLRVRATAIAPDLRFGAAGALAGPGGAARIGHVTIRAEGCLPASLAIPRYLRYADRDAVIVADGAESRGELEACLREHLSAIGERGLADGLGVFDGLGIAVIALDAIDRCFREAGLWPGNVYVVGAATLTAVLGLVPDPERVLRREPGAVLRELAALELAYLFPVAGKFCSGEYDGQIQYRLNGWGRTLAARLSRGRVGWVRAGGYRREIRRHLAAEYRRYRSFLGELDVARQDYRMNRLDSALALPIPVLV